MAIGVTIAAKWRRQWRGGFEKRPGANLSETWRGEKNRSIRRQHQTLMAKISIENISI
jgi:hypothetical protein